MSLKVYISGQLYDKDDAKISVYDHGLLYGDGVGRRELGDNNLICNLAEGDYVFILGYTNGNGAFFNSNTVVGRVDRNLICNRGDIDRSHPV